MVWHYLICGFCCGLQLHWVWVSVNTSGKIVLSEDNRFTLPSFSIQVFSCFWLAILLIVCNLVDRDVCIHSCAGIICGPLLFTWIVFSGELNTALHFESLHVLGFQVLKTSALTMLFWWRLFVCRLTSFPRSNLLAITTRYGGHWCYHLIIERTRPCGDHWLLPFWLQICVVLSCMMAFCLNYTIFLNTTINSALTQTMCGNLKVCCVSLSWLFNSLNVCSITRESDT